MSTAGERDSCPGCKHKMMPAPATLMAATAARRQALARRIGDGVVVLTAAVAATKSRDTPYHPYRQDSYLYYLSACPEAKTALLLTAQNGKLQEEIFFCPQRNVQAQQWDGERLNPTTAKRRLGITATADINTLPAVLSDRAAAFKILHYLPGNNDMLDRMVTDMARKRRAGNRASVGGAVAFADISAPLDAMRLIKDDVELDCLRAACRLTCDGVKAAMRAAKTAKNEFEVDAAIIHSYRRGNANHAFAPIVAGGKNACVLHYTANNRRLSANNMLLVDTGCELNGYAGDITRTFPISGAWKEGAHEIYDIVLSAQKKTVRAAKPGVRWDTLEKTAAKQLSKGLRELGLCRGSVADIMQKHQYQRFYPHRIGHWLGMDVHDVGSMQEADGSSRRLRPRMVLTIEPGLYIPDNDDIPQRWRGIGVRIEDDVLITANGNDVLTADAPKTPTAIQQWMSG